jgi:hypothetical protein
MAVFRTWFWRASLTLFISVLLLCPAVRAKQMEGLMAPGSPNASFTLRTGIAKGKMVFIGKGGAIDGQVNPVLLVHEDEIVQVTLINARAPSMISFSRMFMRVRSGLLGLAPAAPLFSEPRLFLLCSQPSRSRDGRCAESRA